MIEYVRKDARVSQKAIDRAELHFDASNTERLFEEWREAERRAAPRYEVTGAAQVTIFAAPTGRERIRFEKEGYTKDLSATGVCVILKGPPASMEDRRWAGCRAKVRLELKGSEGPLNLPARVAWVKQGKSGVRLGLEFQDVPAPHQKVLQSCCREDDGELRRIRNLWQVLVSEASEKD